MDRKALVPIAAALLAACNGNYDGPGGITGGSAQTLVSTRIGAQPVQGLTTFKLYVAGVVFLNTADSTKAFNVSKSKTAVNLLALDDTLTDAVDTLSIPKADYSVRLVVDSARVALAPPLTFSNGDSARTYVVPLALKRFVALQTVTVTGVRQVFVFAVDARKSFSLTGPAAHPNAVTVAPLLRVLLDTAAVSIAGTVTPATNHDTLYAVVHGDSVATAFADTTTGAYVLRLVPSPDTVTVVAHGNTFAASKVVVTRFGRDTTGINLP